MPKVEIYGIKFMIELLNIMIMSAFGLQQINTASITFLEQVEVEPLVTVEIIEEVLTEVQNNLADFAASVTFETNMLTVLGKSGNVDLRRTIIDGLAGGEDLPQIIVVPLELMNVATGGFDFLTGTVYLADSLVNPNSVIGSENPAVIVSQTKPSLNLLKVLTEELAHNIDSKLNLTDTPGDEGEYWAALVSGEEIQRSLTGDDRVEILNKAVVVEANSVLPTFTTNNFPTGSKPTGIATGDFDSNGFQDIVVANYESKTVSVLFTYSKGGVLTTTEFKVGGKPIYVAVGDFNQDGNPDIATTNPENHTVAVLLGDGRGGFSSPNEFPVGERPFGIVVADVNRDGKLDLVTPNTFSNSVSVLLGNGDGSFNVTNYPVQAKVPVFVAVEDFNGDGNQDIVTTNFETQDISMLLGNGTGSFSSLANFVAGGMSPVGVAAEDFNGDGNQDIVVVTEGSRNISVILGTGDGRLGIPNNTLHTGSPKNIAVGDFNGDRQLDIVVANFGYDNVSVLLGTGDGNFDMAINYNNVGDAPVAVVAEDFNGDGKLDIAVTNLESDTVSVLMNTTKKRSQESGVI